MACHADRPGCRSGRSGGFRPPGPGASGGRVSRRIRERSRVGSRGGSSWPWGRPSTGRRSRARALADLGRRAPGRPGLAAPWPTGARFRRLTINDSTAFPPQARRRPPHPHDPRPPDGRPPPPCPPPRPDARSSPPRPPAAPTAVPHPHTPHPVPTPARRPRDPTPRLDHPTAPHDPTPPSPRPHVPGRPHADPPRPTRGGPRPHARRPTSRGRTSPDDPR